MKKNSYFSVAAGYGRYKNDSSLALGLFYTPHKNFMANAGIAWSNKGENMYNIGVSARFGKESEIASLPTDNEEIMLLKYKVEMLENKDKENQKIIKELMTRLSLLENSFKSNGKESVK